MNTPTPAQALGEFFDAVDAARGILTGVISPLGDAHPVAAELIPSTEMVRQHGQHFAGLEADNERLRDIERRSLEAMGKADDDTGYNSAFWAARMMKHLRDCQAKAEAAEAARDGWKRIAEDAIRDHEAAEARCAELEEIVASQAATVAAAYDAATKVEAAEARCAEAEGLLCLWLANTDPRQETAAFLAARG